MHDFLAFNATYGLIAIGAAGFASFFPESERRPAVLCALMLVYVWLSFVLTWTPYSIDLLLTSRYLHIGSIDVWSFNDMLAAYVVYATARRFAWGQMLYGLFLCEALCHFLRWMQAVEWAPYKQTLDLTFYVQEALFYLIGGSCATDRIARSDLWRNRIVPAMAKASVFVGKALP